MAARVWLPSVWNEKKGTDEMTDKNMLLRPVWEGGQVFRETFAMVGDGEPCSAPFLLEPEKVIAIESYDKSCTFDLGRDCYVEDGRLVLTQDSRMPHTGSVSYTHLTLPTT